MTTTTHDFDAVPEAGTLTQATGAFRTSVRAGAYPTIPPDVDAALKAREQLQETFRTLYADTPPLNELPKNLLGAITAGEPLEDALWRTVDAHQERDRRDIAATLIRQSEQHADRHLRVTIATALPQIFAGLRPDLEATVDKLRKAYADAGALDIHQPDPLDVAQATTKQQAALVTIAEATKQYRRIRLLQRQALKASSATVPGANPYRPSWTWDDLAETGLLEVSSPPTGGLPEQDRAPRHAVRAVVSRADVWLPDLADLADAYERLDARISAGQAEARRQAAEAEQAAAGTGPRPAAADTLNARTAVLLDVHTHNNRRS